MEDNKNIDMNPEVKDEELDEVSGGASRRPTQQETKSCARCQKEIPVNKTPGYCDECLQELNKQGVHPFV